MSVTTRIFRGALCRTDQRSVQSVVVSFREAYQIVNKSTIRTRVSLDVRCDGGVSDMTGTSVDQGARPLPPGTNAPDFELRSTPDNTISLAELRGQPVILAFYPADWSPVCSDQMALYQEVLPEFQRFNAELLGISVDGVWCHLAFARDRNLQFPLLCDFEPKGELARAYRVYQAEEGTSERALYVIDSEGIVRWSYVSPEDVNPGADGILRALENLAEEGAS
jgi:peroxiredoxin